MWKELKYNLLYIAEEISEYLIVQDYVTDPGVICSIHVYCHIHILCQIIPEENQIIFHLAEGTKYLMQLENRDKQAQIETYINSHENWKTLSKCSFGMKFQI